MTTIIFPILTFSLTFIAGVVLGIFISSQIEKRIEKSIEKESKKFLTYIDQNGNVIKHPIQDATIEFRNYPKTKIKLNKYELDYLINNIEQHLNNLGETYEENAHVQELFENLIKTKKHGSKSKIDEKHRKLGKKTKTKKRQKS